MTVEDEKVADGPTVPVMDVRVTCSHPLFRFKDIAYHMESNEPTNIAEPLVFHDNRHTSFSFGSANGTVSCQGVFALGIVGKGDVQPETPVYAVFAFYVPIGDNEVKHFMTLAECEPNIDLVRHKGPLKKAYDWNFRHRLMPHNCPIFHGGAIENETFIVRATIAQGSRSRLIISMEPLLESEKVCYHEPHFFVAPR
ncbi:hypothetical protein BDF19DRAFT_309694 [Syncephalis fuscata]|nr:hypothetical protein BDF19DRAFT_309694 [Syncephalis fuscata]